MGHWLPYFSRWDSDLLELVGSLTARRDFSFLPSVSVLPLFSTMLQIDVFIYPPSVQVFPGPKKSTVFFCWVFKSLGKEIGEEFRGTSSKLGHRRRWQATLRSTSSGKVI